MDPLGVPTLRYFSRDLFLVMLIISAMPRFWRKPAFTASTKLMFRVMARQVVLANRLANINVGPLFRTNLRWLSIFPSIEDEMITSDLWIRLEETRFFRNTATHLFDTERWAQFHEAPSTSNGKYITLSSQLSVLMLTDHHCPLGFMNGSQPQVPIKRLPDRRC